MEASLQLIDSTVALQPLLVAAEDSKGANLSTIRSIVMKAFSDPDIFCGYDEIKRKLLPALQQTASSESDKIVATLDLFSYGNYTDYFQTPDTFLALADSQITKLRQLTVLTLVHDACLAKRSTVQYNDIYKALQLDDRRQVQDVVMSCLYSRVLSGKLCSKSQSLVLSSRHGPTLCSRDVPVAELPRMLAQLVALADRLDGSHQELAASQSVVLQDLARHEQFIKEASERQDGNNNKNNNKFAHSARSNWGDDLSEGRAAARRQKRSRGGLNNSLGESAARL